MRWEREEAGGHWETKIVWPESGAQRVYDLSQALRPGIPHHPAHPPFAFTLTKQHGEFIYPGGVSAASELITLGGHVGTHVDSLGHVSRDGRIHGEEDITSAQSYTGGIGRGSIEGVLPFLTPGHLMDVPTLRGRRLDGNDVISASDFSDWFSDRGDPAPGSTVLVRTGWDDLWEDNRSYMGSDGGTPGVDESGARWLTKRRVRATGSDTIAYEKLPAPGLPVHVHLLVDAGVHIMEALNLRHLAAEQVWEFFFIAVPLPIRGGTGSPIRPLAIVSSD